MKRVICLIFIPLSALSAIKEPKPKINFIDKAHNSLSEQLLDISETIDAYFAAKKYKEKKNKTQLRLSLLIKGRESIDPIYESDINFQFVLPRTQKRLSLILEPTDNDEISETSDSQRLRRSNRSDSSATNIGLRYLLKKAGFKISTDTGAVVQLPQTKFFSRLSLKKVKKFSKWKIKFEERLLWVNTSGLSSEFNMNFERKLSDFNLFRFVNNMTWDDSQNIIEFENGPSFFQKIDKDISLSYHAHIFTENKPGIAVTNYLLQITYKQNIYKNWIFANLSPFLNFPRSNQFQREPGFNIRLNMLIGYY